MDLDRSGIWKGLPGVFDWIQLALPELAAQPAAAAQTQAKQSGIAACKRLHMIDDVAGARARRR
ncbi:MAG: hypothetical protein JWN34_4046 [Bryobacterales bacterium]|nr:hypothetical protein [Bryobacterales bacterium]